MMKKLSLKLLMLLLVGSMGSYGLNAQVLFDEAFTGGASSTGFTINQTAGVCGWAYNNPGGRTVTGAGFDADFAMFDSDACGSGTMTAELISPAFDATAADIYTLEFDHQYRYCCSSVAAVDVFDGTTWNNVYTLPASSVNYPNPAGTESIDISTASGNSAVAQVRFTYSANFAWWWALDNISVTQSTPPTCPDPTGLLISNITSGSIDVAWNSTNPGAFTNFAIVPSGGSPSITDLTALAVSGANAATITTSEGVAMSGNTAYDLYYQEDCSLTTTGFSTLLGPFPFITLCGVFTPDYDEDFTSFLPTCWDEADGGDAGTGPSSLGTGPWTSSTSLGTGSARINLFTTSRSDWLLSPDFDLSAGGYEVVVDVAVTNWNSAAADAMGSDDLVRLLLTEVGVSWSTVASWSAADALPNTPTQFSYALASTGANVKFGILATDGPTDDLEDYDFHVANFKVQTPPACPDVTGISTGNYSLTNVTASYNPVVGAGFYSIEIQNAPNAQGTPGAIFSGSTASTNPNITGTYVDGNDYIFYVRSDCSGTPGNWQSYPFTMIIPPANDDCGGAIPLTLGAGACGTPTPGNNTGATDSGIAHGCASYNGGDIWYSVVVPASGNVTVQSFDTGSPWSDGGMAIYEGTCPGGLLQVDCDDDGGTSAFERIALTGRTPGETLYIAVWEFGNNAFGDMEICAWEPAGPPANDECEGAVVLTVNPDLSCTSFASGTLDQATASVFEESCSGTFDNDVWFKFTATGAEHQISTFNRAGSSTDMVYQLSTGTSCATLGQIQCHDTPDDGFTATGLTPGNDYYIRVDTWTSTASNTTFDICVGTIPPPPANDDCGGAVAVTSSTWGTSGWIDATTASATQSLSGCFGTANDDVWFSFVAQSANDAVLARGAEGANFDAVIEIFDGCGGTSLQCEDSNGSSNRGLERALPGNLIPGNTYYYRVYHYFSGDPSDFSFQTQVKTFEDSQLRAPSCGAADLSLDQVIYSENDAAGQLYSNPGVPVTGYAFRFQEQGGALDVTIEQPTADGFYFQLINAGLEYGKSYDVSVSHRVNVPANGFIDAYWSQFGTVCSISMASLPTTQLRAEYCTGAVEYYLSDQLQADVVIGASDYRFTFVPAGPFNTLVKESANYAVNLQTVGSAGNRLLYGVSYTVTVEALVNGTWSAPGSVCTILMATQPEDTEVKSAYCGGTYSYPSSNFILAESVVGATAYEFQFSPQPSGTVLTKLVNTVSFAFGPSSLPFVAGTTYNVQVRAYSGAISGDYVDTGCEITILAPPMMDQENLTSNEEAKAGDLISTPEYSLFPNPNDGTEFMLSRLDRAFDEGTIGIEVLDITGKLLHTEMKAVKGDSRVLVNPASDLSTGLYLLRITDEKGTQTLRFTVD